MLALMEVISVRFFCDSLFFIAGTLFLIQQKSFSVLKNTALKFRYETNEHSLC